MYTRDPYDVPTPQAPRPETPDHIKAFYSQIPDMRPTVRGRETPATLNTCRTLCTPDGKRTMYHMRGCHHFPEQG
jgi:hypothetical protein